MAKPLDNDLRIRIVGTMQEVGCCRAVGRQFRVAASTELQQNLLAERGVQVSEDTVRRFVRSLEFTFKLT